jgi:hypothetical protein
MRMLEINDNASCYQGSGALTELLTLKHVGVGKACGGHCDDVGVVRWDDDCEAITGLESRIGLDRSCRADGDQGRWIGGGMEERRDGVDEANGIFTRLNRARTLC